PPQTITLTGISAGIGDTSQVVFISASSSNRTLIPNPAITFPTSPGTALLTYVPQPNQSGTATITVTVTDNGSTTNGGRNTTTATFTVNVTAVDQAPTLNPIPDIKPPLAVNAPQQSVNLAGISAGPGDTGQNITITATSSNTALI